jgi:ribosomal protein L11 methylase PrmA
MEQAMSLTVGQVVSIKMWDNTIKGWTQETAEVVNPDYSDAFGPSFTGRMLTGRHKGTTLALQIAHIKGMETP